MEFFLFMLMTFVIVIAAASGDLHILCKHVYQYINQNERS